MLDHFYATMLKLSVTFYTSPEAKDISLRFLKKRDTFTKIESAKAFQSLSTLALTTGQFYIHMCLNPVHTNNERVFPLLRVDIDSKLNGKAVLDCAVSEVAKNFQNITLPFYSSTPHGLHLFFKNSINRKNRVYNKVLGLGLIADLLPRGWVTFIGPGYNFYALANPKPLDDLPFFLMPINNTKGFLANGQLLDFSYNFFLNHFSITRRVRNTVTAISNELAGWKGLPRAPGQVFLQCGYLFIYFFKVPDGLAKLLVEFEFYGPPKAPIEGTKPFVLSLPNVNVTKVNYYSFLQTEKESESKTNNNQSNDQYYSKPIVQSAEPVLPLNKAQSLLAQRQELYRRKLLGSNI